eukprot:TRINITY_DN39439_c0_g1_i16.p1 TRINITY_DN39439_c0_g1~~TRINITY_DN39439_c0_g1_i16.p1  ORF type:complete len:241 (-),score=-16.13 TRINITY_DN39439_c0_g1_i16:177-899(-)
MGIRFFNDLVKTQTQHTIFQVLLFVKIIVVQYLPLFMNIYNIWLQCRLLGFCQTPSNSINIDRSCTELSISCLSIRFFNVLLQQLQQNTQYVCLDIYLDSVEVSPARIISDDVQPTKIEKSSRKIIALSLSIQFSYALFMIIIIEYIINVLVYIIFRQKCRLLKFCQTPSGQRIIGKVVENLLGCVQVHNSLMHFLQQLQQNTYSLVLIRDSALVLKPVFNILFNAVRPITIQENFIMSS